MKKFTIEFTEDNGNVSCKRNVEGYSGIEVIAMLDIIKTEYLIEVINGIAIKDNDSKE